MKTAIELIKDILTLIIILVLLASPLLLWLLIFYRLNNSIGNALEALSLAYIIIAVIVSVFMISVDFMTKNINTYILKANNKHKRGSSKIFSIFISYFLNLFVFFNWLGFYVYVFYTIIRYPNVFRQDKYKSSSDIFLSLDFDVIILFVQIITFILLWFYKIEINNFYHLQITIYLLLFSTLGYLLYYQLQFNEFLKRIKLAQGNSFINYGKIGVLIFTLFFIGAIVLSGSNIVQLNQSLIAETTSEFLGAKKIRLWSYGIIENLSFSDLFIAFSGFIFNLTILKSIFSFKKLKRNPDDYYSQALLLTKKGDFIKAEKKFEKIGSNNMKRGYWSLKSMLYLMKGDLDSALQSVKYSFPVTKKISKDQSFLLLHSFCFNFLHSEDIKKAVETYIYPWVKTLSKEEYLVFALHDIMPLEILDDDFIEGLEHLMADKKSDFLEDYFDCLIEGTPIENIKVDTGLKKILVLSIKVDRCFNSELELEKRITNTISLLNDVKEIILNIDDLTDLHLGSMVIISHKINKKKEKKIINAIDSILSEIHDKKNIDTEYGLSSMSIYQDAVYNKGMRIKAENDNEID